MGKEEHPGVTDPVMEVDLALGRIDGKIRSGIADLEAHGSFLSRFASSLPPRLQRTAAARIDLAQWRAVPTGYHNRQLGVQGAQARWRIGLAKPHQNHYVATRTAKRLLASSLEAFPLRFLRGGITAKKL
jgi:hypothetical protein